MKRPAGTGRTAATIALSMLTVAVAYIAAGTDPRMETETGTLTHSDVTADLASLDLDAFCAELADRAEAEGRTVERESIMDSDDGSSEECEFIVGRHGDEFWLTVDYRRDRLDEFGCHYGRLRLISGVPTCSDGWEEFAPGNPEGPVGVRTYVASHGYVFEFEFLATEDCCTATADWDWRAFHDEIVGAVVDFVRDAAKREE